jgi:hypothetical protein
VLALVGGAAPADVPTPVAAQETPQETRQ